jgi:hypothetical protein
MVLSSLVMPASTAPLFPAHPGKQTVVLRRPDGCLPLQQPERSGARRGTNVYYGAILRRSETVELSNRSRPGDREDRPVAPRERVERCGARRDGDDAIVAIIVIEESVLPYRVRRGGMRHWRHRRVNDGQQERERADEVTGHTHRPYLYPRALVKKKATGSCR